jgi:hypothetical protein
VDAAVDTPNVEADCTDSGAFQKIPTAFAEGGTLTLTTAGCRSLGVPGLLRNFERFGLERTSGGLLAAITTATDVRGNPATCTVKASLSNLSSDMTSYYLYYKDDNEAPMLWFFVTKTPLYVGTGPFPTATGMRIFEGKLSAARCN